MRAIVPPAFPLPLEDEGVLLVAQHTQVADLWRWYLVLPDDREVRSQFRELLLEHQKALRQREGRHWPPNWSESWLIYERRSTITAGVAQLLDRVRVWT